MTEKIEDGTEYGLISRLVFLIGKESTRNFANRVGVKDSTLRSVLKGTRPSIDFVISVANGSGASLEWLATGQGKPYLQGEGSKNQSFNRQLYDMISQCVERVFSETGAQVAPGVIAATVIDCYDEVSDIVTEGDIDEYRSLLPWIEYGLRKQALYHLAKKERD